MPSAKGFVIHESTLPYEGWEDVDESALRWRTLLGAPDRQTEGITLGVVEIAAGEVARSRNHRHREPEAYYVLSGRGVISIDGIESPIEAGTAAYIPGRASHHARNTGDELLRILYVFPSDAFAEIEYEFED